MDPAKNFSVNLRRECSRFNSIAEICRGTKINRQQFNKYLAGDHLPNSRTRKKLCEFLGVEEAQMFLPHEDLPSIRSDVHRVRPSNQELNEQAMSALKLLQSFGYDNKDGLPAIKPGFYGCYFPLQGIPDMIVRTMIKITKHESMTTFVRHTCFNSIRFPNRRLAKNRHAGLVLTKSGLSYLIGMKSDEPHHLSYLVFNNNGNFGKDIYVGMGTTQGSDRPISSLACLEYCGTSFSSAKSLARTLGVNKLSDSSIPFPVSSVFHARSEGLAGQLGLPRVEDTSLFGAMLSMRPSPPELEQNAKYTI